VITSPMTFIATLEAIVQTGARPVLVDIDPSSCNLSIPALSEYLAKERRHSRKGARAILPVHLYGLPARLDELRTLAREYGLKLVEDACQAHGARIRLDGRWAYAGAVGDAGCFSFYPGKNLGAWGEGGAVATNDDELAAAIVRLRDHGRLSHYAHSVCGYNARLDTIQAAVLRAKLARLTDWNHRRRAAAARYRELLADSDLQAPADPEDAESCYHLFVVRSARRDQIRQALLAAGIECGIHYPVPLHLQPACRFLGYHPGDFPASEAAADTVLSLPMHPHLKPEEINRVAEAVRAVLAQA